MVVLRPLQGLLEGFGVRGRLLEACVVLVPLPRRHILPTVRSFAHLSQMQDEAFSLHCDRQVHSRFVSA
jgi:hypothetical protein